MNGFSLNAAAIDAGGVVAQYAFLPTSTVGIVLGLGQFNVGLMSGSLSLNLDATGDVVKRIQIGTGTTNLGQDASGLMSALKELPSVTADVAVAVSGSLSMTGGLTGALDITLEVGGYPFATMEIGSASVDMSLSVSGALTNKQFLSGESALALETFGSLSVGVVTPIPPGTVPVALLLSAPTIALIPGLGIADVALNMTGELSRRIHMAGSAELGLAVSGDLSVGLRNYMGPDVVPVALLVTGDLSVGVVTALPPSGTALALNLYADTIRLLSGLGIADLTLGLTGDLARLIPISGSSAISLNATGDLAIGLRNYMGPDAVALALDVVGNLAVRIAMQGTTGLQLVAEGALAVNATAKDIDQNTLVRPATDRTMTRTP